MRTEALIHTARGHIFLYTVAFLLAIQSLVHAQSITELKTKAEDGDVQAQSALARAYHLGEGVAKDDADSLGW